MNIGVIPVSLACAAMSAGGCDSRVCTLIGCSDGFSANVRSADGNFPSGVHRVEVLVDGASLTCTFVYPNDGTSSQKMCDADLSVTVWSETTCSETMMVSYPCDPIPGKFYESIALPGTPGQVHVWQYVDDTAVLDAAVAPSYQEFAPNGRECGPICRQATASLMFQ